MTIEYQLTIDCADPGRLVAFWASALGYVPKPPPDGFATWRDYYLSIDIPAEELGEGDCTDRLIDPSLARAGATVVRTDDTPEHDHYSVLLQDPEGNEFCVV